MSKVDQCLLKEYRMFTSTIFSAKHWILFIIIRSIHFLFMTITSGSLHLDSSNLEHALDVSTLMFLHVHVD